LEIIGAKIGVKGNPTEVRNVTDGIVKKDPLDLFEYLNDIVLPQAISPIESEAMFPVNRAGLGIYLSPM